MKMSVRHKLRIFEIPVVILNTKWKDYISQKRAYGNFTYTKRFYVHEIAVVNLSKKYFLKKAKKTCKPNNRDLNRDWIKTFVIIFKELSETWECTFRKRVWDSRPHFKYDFSRKLFLMLNSISLPNFIDLLPLLPELLDKIPIVIICFALVLS